MRWLWLLLCSCSTPQMESSPVVAAVAAPDSPKKTETVGVQSGVQHPPIPANSPAWRHDPGGFVPDHNFYGERSWDGVRMRVAGHIAVIERDRARLAAQSAPQGLAAAGVYRSLADVLAALIPDSGGPETEIPTLARNAALRDAALLEGTPLAGLGGVAGVRASLHRHQKAGTMTATVAERLRSELASVVSNLDFPDIDAFADFDDRHAMRVKLWALYLDAVDPVEFSDPWGYFDAAAHARMVQLLDAKIARAGGMTVPDPAPVSGRFTVDGAGGMPTGDSLIDVAGQPGPRAIGTLEKLGLDDPKHRQWVEDTAFVMNAKLAEQPGGVLSILHTRTAHLDGMGHGSRYYNIKQLRNEAVRQLARSGHYTVAKQALEMNFPLHHQDWECPNRTGILMAINGRLAALAHQGTAADTLKRARGSTDDFLKKVDAAQAAGPPTR